MAKIRSTAAQSLLEDIASSGAAAGNTHGLHTPASPALDELLERGYVCPMELFFEARSFAEHVQGASGDVPFELPGSLRALSRVIIYSVHFNPPMKVATG